VTVTAKGAREAIHVACGNGARVAAVRASRTGSRVPGPRRNDLAEVTHDHSEGIKGAQAVAAAIYLGRTRASKADINALLSGAEL
jgi:ADP-ribosylglycohydrolase